MLVLSRRHNEKIQIGDNITITIVRVHGGQVRLGIQAPKTLRIMREELCHAPRPKANGLDPEPPHATP